MSVGTFRNVIASESPFTWTVFEDLNGVVRIKSEEDNLYLQSNDTSIILAPDAKLTTNSPSNPSPNLARQHWILQPIEKSVNTFVLINIGNGNTALAFDRSNRVVSAKFKSIKDRGIDLKTFVLEEI